MPSGGKRAGSGRKPGLVPKTVTISFRVLETKAEELKQLIKALIKSWNKLNQQ